jgi:hypothetical protein
MRQYRSLVHVLDRDLAVRPLPETTQLYEDVRAGRLAAPPLPSAAAVAVAAATGTADQVAVLDWPLVGRAAELSALRSAWRSAGAPGAPGADGARGRAVAIIGQAGSGKSRLVEELRAEAVGAGGTVLVARCHDGESALPFVLAADLLRSALNVCPELPDLLPAQTIAMAGRLVPGLADVQQDPRSPALDSPAAVARMYAAIADTLRVAAGAPAQGRNGQRRPASVIAVEDVHWADNSSLGLLSYLVLNRFGICPPVACGPCPTMRLSTANTTAHRRATGPSS